MEIKLIEEIRAVKNKSDMTRTYFFGKPTVKQKELNSVILK